jgi:hypothetical protein
MVAAAVSTLAKGKNMVATAATTLVDENMIEFHKKYYLCIKHC